MTITAELRDRVRQRANFACEYCGVTETATGGMRVIVPLADLVVSATLVAVTVTVCWVAIVAGAV